MTDYTRQRDWFDPDRTNASATIVGCGGIGSFTAFALAKLGVQRLALVDFDSVEEHNIPNQMFLPGQVDMLKVDALADTLAIAAGVQSLRCPADLLDYMPLNDVVISALDSMHARKDLWATVKYKTKCRLFLDARLGGQHVILYAVNPVSPDDVAGYEATLYSDEEASDLPCTARSVIDVGFSVAALITRAVRLHYARSPLPRTTYLNQETLEIHKGGWDR